jgi:hypothetical protein
MIVGTRPNGEGGWAQREFGSTHLARPWSATAPDAPVQVVQRSAFVDKLRDVVGLYVDPPAHAIVLSVDEKSQIQARSPSASRSVLLRRLRS